MLFDPWIDEVDEQSSTSQVPVSNLFYLLCYATRCLGVRGRISVEDLDGPTSTPTSLYAEIMDKGLSSLTRRGFPKQYLDYEEETAYPRGRINLSATVARALLPQRKVSCNVSELVYDHSINRALKATARSLVIAPGVSLLQKVHLRRHIQMLAAVADHPLQEIDIVECRRQRRLDEMVAFLLQICGLVQRSSLIKPSGDGESFVDLRRSAQEMGRVFENFLFHFYRRESEFQVSSPQLEWDLTSDAHVDAEMLPTMKTDLMLESEGVRVLIEAKCTARTTESFFGGRPKLRPKHLYQILNYLDHVSPDHRPKVGLLLYAQSGDPLDLKFEIAGHRLVVRSIDLMQDWQEIHRDVLAVAAAASTWAA